jgi:hypothetical protein
MGAGAANRSGNPNGAMSIAVMVLISRTADAPEPCGGNDVEVGPPPTPSSRHAQDRTPWAIAAAYASAPGCTRWASSCWVTPFESL